MSWEKTWLYRFRDVYLVPWKLTKSHRSRRSSGTSVRFARRKGAVAMMLEQYNQDLTLTPEEDAAFAKLARERTARHPLRTYFWLPAARAVTVVVYARIELSGFRYGFSVSAILGRRSHRSIGYRGAFPA